MTRSISLILAGSYLRAIRLPMTYIWNTIQSTQTELQTTDPHIGQNHFKPQPQSTREHQPIESKSDYFIGVFCLNKGRTKSMGLISWPQPSPSNQPGLPWSFLHHSTWVLAPFLFPKQWGHAWVTWVCAFQHGHQCSNMHSRKRVIKTTTLKGMSIHQS